MTHRHFSLALATITPALVTGGVALAATGGLGGHASGHVHAAKRRGGPLVAMRHPLRSRLTSADIRLFVKGQVHDFRLDRGIVQSAGNGSVTLKELDGTMVTVPVDASTRVHNDRKPATLADVKPGEVAFTLRRDNGPARQLRAGKAMAPAAGAAQPTPSQPTPSQG